MNCLGLTRYIDFMRRRNYHSTKNIEWKDTKPYIPPVNSGLVIKVYDGDTITIATQVYNDKTLYRFSVRLNGIDCPEMKTNNNNEKIVAIMAKNRVTEMIYRKNITLKNVKKEKYGRLLADVYYNNICINNVLLKERLAVKYDGGTKITPKDWDGFSQ